MQFIFKLDPGIIFFKKIIPLVGLIFTLWSIAVAFLTNTIYSLIIIWPICFTLFTFFCYSPFSKNQSYHEIGISLIIIFELLPRYIIYPILLMTRENSYSGVLHDTFNINDFNIGVVLGALELLILTLFVILFERLSGQNASRQETSKRLYLSGNKLIYIVYIMLAFILYLIVGRHYNIIQFMSIETGYDEVTGSIYITLLKYIISIALTLSILMILNRQKIKYYYNYNKLHLLIAVFCAMIYTGFIIGESRSTQVAIGALMLMILVKDYPRFKKMISISMFSSILIVVLSITFFRTGAYNLTGEGFNGLTDKLQVYHGGPFSIIQPIKLLQENIDLTINNFVFDFIRSSFPFNLFIKNNSYTTSQMFNLILYKGKFTHGHIIFGASYGFLYFGWIGIPLIMCLNYFLISKANEVYHKTSSYEIKYLSGYCMIRLVAAFLVNTPTILGSVTQYIGTFGLLIVVSNFFGKSINKGTDNV